MTPEHDTPQAAASGRILVVEDNRTNRLALQRILEQQGHRVGLAVDGREALAALAAGLDGAPYDVVLLDIILPEMDGYAVLSRMMEQPDLRHIPVIVISALDEIDVVVRCIELGAEDYLPKPFNAVLLKARLNASLRRKRLRDLEQAYLRQEIVLRQSEKLATLGRLSAGVAHELNNPAAAIQRGASQAALAFRRHLDADAALDAAAGDIHRLAGWLERLAPRPNAHLDPLDRSDREDALALRLEQHSVEHAWELAPELVDAGMDPEALDALAADHAAEQLPALLAWLAGSSALLDLLGELADAAQRIATIVRALKSYTYLDRAPVQNVDVHEGLESTLTMLRSKLRGVTIRRHYAPELPRIEAYSSELNQVWTNLIDNAAAALGGKGALTIATRRDGEGEGSGIVVEVGDTGGGIPADVLPMLFEPFFTTKPPGEGTGLGLNITHGIIVNKHGGAVSVRSQPGDTRFTVHLPLRLPKSPTQSQAQTQAQTQAQSPVQSAHAPG